MNEIVVQNLAPTMAKQIFYAFKLLKCIYNELSSDYYGRFLKFLKWRETNFEKKWSKHEYRVRDDDDFTLEMNITAEKLARIDNSKNELLLFPFGDFFLLSNINFNNCK